MAYVGDPFVYDIFVTYSHGDSDGVGESRLELWSAGFTRELEAELRVHPRFGRSVRVFFDQHPDPKQRIDPMVGLTDQLKDALTGTAVLTVLMSPHYLRSEWCRAEREWWHEKQAALGIPLDGRIAVAHVWPTDEPWPFPLSDSGGNPLVGFCFYDRARVSFRPQPYDWPEPGPHSRDPFRKELLDLVGWLTLKLEDLKRRLDERKHAAQGVLKLVSEKNPVVYLHGRVEYALDWERVSDSLAQSGLVVVPSEPDPLVDDAKRLQVLRMRRVETMTGCDAILLLGAGDGRSVDADLVVVGRQDRGSARALSNHLLPCALLNGIGPSLATAKRRLTARQLDVDWIDAPDELLPPAVREWLTGVGQGDRL
jgi:hypothetical protein